jgi:hypothetical protein
MLWLWRWGLSPPDRGRSRGHRSYLRRVCRLKKEELKCQRKNRKSREQSNSIALAQRRVCAKGVACSVQNEIFLRFIARFCMLCSQNAERLSRADPGWLVRKVMGEAG